MGNIIRFRRPEKREPERAPASLLRPWLTFLLLVAVLTTLKWFGLGDAGNRSTGQVADASGGAVSVVDGDSLVVGGTRVRLYGIDAPEGPQSCNDAAGAAYPCGERAAAALRELVRGKTVHCDPRGLDEYRRTVAICTADGIDLNAEQVETGMAVAYQDISPLYLPNEERAKENRRGVWAGSFQMPWDYRREARRREGETPQSRN